MMGKEGSLQRQPYRVNNNNNNNKNNNPDAARGQLAVAVKYQVFGKMFKSIGTVKGMLMENREIAGDNI